MKICLNYYHECCFIKWTKSQHFHYCTDFWFSWITFNQFQFIFYFCITWLTNSSFSYVQSPHLNITAEEENIDGPRHYYFGSLMGIVASVSRAAIFVSVRKLCKNSSSSSTMLITFQNAFWALLVNLVWGLFYGETQFAKLLSKLWKRIWKVCQTLKNLAIQVKYKFCVFLLPHSSQS